TDGIANLPGFPAKSAIQFFVPGLLIMNAMFSAGFEGFSLMDKVESGFLERLRVTPVSRLALALGFVFETSVTLIIQSLILVLLSLFLGFQSNLVGIFVLLVLILLIGITMSSISFTLALFIREGGILAGIINTFVLPLMIISGVMLPLDFAPGIIQAISKFDPFTYAVSASRSLVTGVFSGGSIISAFIIFIVLAVGALVWFIRAMREAVA
ncbi:MAG: ABC transporter permease, partial [Patescibacteria group bacterium]|nr:ABC transporter permease [Patescibacteria group bacterium]